MQKTPLPAELEWIRNLAFIPSICRRLCAGAAILAIAGCLDAAAQTLAWDPNTEADLAGYRVHQGAGSRNYTLVTDVGNVTSYAVDGLGPGTWCFAVTAYNNSGLESGFSDEVCAAVAIDSTPPVLTGRATRIVTNEDASIVWATDEAARGMVEYGTSADYGNTVEAAGVSTAQSVRLSGLAPDTTYHYRIVIRDSSGNTFVTRDATFSTAPSPSTIVPAEAAGYPHPIGDTPFVGLGLTNTGAAPATVRLTALDAAGLLIAGPVALLLAPGEQVLALDAQLFGDRIAGPDPAWVKVESSAAGTVGIFFGLDDGPTRMDGGTLQWAGLSEFILPGSGDMNLLNPHSDTCSARLELVAADGTVLGSTNRVIPGNGALAANAGLLFPGVTDSASGYLRVNTTLDVFSFASALNTAESLAVVPGLDTRRFSPTLYAPDFLGGAGWRSTIMVVNTEDLPGSFTARLFADDGNPIGEAVAYHLPARGSLRIPETELMLADPLRLTRGYVEISTNVALAGTLTIEFNGRAASAFRLVDARRRSFVVGQVASDSAYYTGVALLNPGPEAASVTLELHLPDGTLLHTWSGTLAPRGRTVQLMTEYFPDLAGREIPAGYVKVSAAGNIAALALFGRNDLTVLSAIPPE